MKHAKADDQAYHAPEDIYFEEETGYVLAQIDKSDYDFLDQAVEYRGKTFQPKEELHITIVSQGVAERLKEHLQKRTEDVKRVQRLLQGSDWSYHTTDQFFHVVKEPGVETIVQMVHTPGLKAFYQQLGQLLGESLEPPPTHVTLYTRGTSKGIGIPDRTAFEQLVEGRVDPQSLKPSG